MITENEYILSECIYHLRSALFDIVEDYANCNGEKDPHTLVARDVLAKTYGLDEYESPEKLLMVLECFKTSANKNKNIA